MFDWYYTDYEYLFSPVVKNLLELVITGLDIMVAIHIIYAFVCSKDKYNRFYTKWSWVCLLKVMIFAISHNNIKSAFNLLNVDTLIFMLFNLTALCLLVVLVKKIIFCIINFAKIKSANFILICCFMVISIGMSIHLFGNSWFLLGMEFIFYYSLNYIVFAAANIHILYEYMSGLIKILF